MFFRLLMPLFSLLVILALAGCNRPTTPVDVAEAFWKAVVEEDARQAVRYSTLEDTAGFDGFARSWPIQPELTRVVVERQRAEITTRLPEAGFTTYLVYRDDQWLVDYENTNKSVNPPSAMEQFMQSFTQVGRELSRQVNQSSESLREQLDTLTQDWQTLSEEAQQRLEDRLVTYSAQLRITLDELRAAIEQTLAEHQDAPDDIRERLGSAANALSDSSNALAEPGLNAIRQASRTLADTSRELAEISDNSVRELKQQWQRQLDALAERNRQLQQEAEEE